MVLCFIYLVSIFQNTVQLQKNKTGWEHESKHLTDSEENGMECFQPQMATNPRKTMLIT